MTMQQHRRLNSSPAKPIPGGRRTDRQAGSRHSNERVAYHAEQARATALCRHLARKLVQSAVIALRIGIPLLCGDHRGRGRSHRHTVQPGEQTTSGRHKHCVLQHRCTFSSGLCSRSPICPINLYASLKRHPAPGRYVFRKDSKQPICSQLMPAAMQRDCSCT